MIGFCSSMKQTRMRERGIGRFKAKISRVAIGMTLRALPLLSGKNIGIRREALQRALPGVPFGDLTAAAVGGLAVALVSFADTVRPPAANAARNRPRNRRRKQREST